MFNIAEFMLVLVINKLDQVLIKENEVALPWTFSQLYVYWIFFIAKWPVTPNCLTRHVTNSNSFENLCLSSISANLKSLRPKVKAL